MNSECVELTSILSTGIIELKMMHIDNQINASSLMACQTKIKSHKNSNLN